MENPGCYMFREAATSRDGTDSETLKFLKLSEEINDQFAETSMAERDNMPIKGQVVSPFVL